ncbi:MAG: ribosomal protein S18-alanine N-acetyltransferase [Clostridia bacterium]|jgi:ribosomal-protein-alanine N-acetyltransferase|nr:ribosomal protein S18-alanine N-acetyltransferase [Clostridia bacterium]MBQ1963688.1 ribosomal protein S18-alanine N-acetyltransferase [Clostridia bacterium]MBQ5833626.1 ribosomal protein S18-alanine N-acetyltransferase [Clostridia bacterium]
MRTEVGGREAGILLCPIERVHLPQVALLESLCFSEPWSERSLELLLGEEALGAVLLVGDRVAAYGGMLLAPGEGQITNIATHPDFRRMGYGRAVLDALLSGARQKDCEQVALEVRASNEGAIRMYEQAGFLTAGRRRGFYRNPTEDALVMLHGGILQLENNGTCIF